MFAIPAALILTGKALFLGPILAITSLVCLKLNLIEIELNKNRQDLRLEAYSLTKNILMFYEEQKKEIEKALSAPENASIKDSLRTDLKTCSRGIELYKKTGDKLAKMHPKLELLLA